MTKKSSKKEKRNNKAWVVAADMGYGHQRAAYPLHDIAYQKVFSANSDKILSDEEKASWNRLEFAYETMSRYSQNSWFGGIIFAIYDQLQSISSLYPFRDLSRANWGVLYCEYLIKRKKLASSIIAHIKTKNKPLITTFYLIALAADYAGVKPVYCIVTDSDINRVWVSRTPEKSNIIYLVPCRRTKKRLLEYGVKEDNIIITGFPLPKENIGSSNQKILKHDLAQRISVLDKNRIFFSKYKETLQKRFNIKNLPKPKRKVTITFAIGGAGAQKEIPSKLIHALRKEIKNHEIVLNIMLGMHYDYYDYFVKIIQEYGLQDCIGKAIQLHQQSTKPEYFKAFNIVMRTTDILWTKPSELSFYTGLGIPIIMAAPVGAHEQYNRRWLIDIGSGIDPQEIEATGEWLHEMLQSGKLAECAWNGYIDTPTMGTYSIEHIVRNRFTFKDVKDDKRYTFGNY